MAHFHLPCKSDLQFQFVFGLWDLLFWQDKENLILEAVKHLLNQAIKKGIINKTIAECLLTPMTGVSHLNAAQQRRLWTPVIATTIQLPRCGLGLSYYSAVRADIRPRAPAVATSTWICLCYGGHYCRMDDRRARSLIIADLAGFAPPPLAMAPHRASWLGLLPRG